MSNKVATEKAEKAGCVNQSDDASSLVSSWLGRYGTTAAYRGADEAENIHSGIEETATAGAYHASRFVAVEW